MADLAESQLQQLQEHKEQGTLGPRSSHIGNEGQKNTWNQHYEELRSHWIGRDIRHVLTKLEQKYHETLKAKK